MGIDIEFLVLDVALGKWSHVPYPLVAARS
jgi:hypothetical protein